MTGDGKVKLGRSGPPPMKLGKFYINPTLEDQMEIQGFRKNAVRFVLTWIAIVLTVGLMRLFFYWLPHYMLRCTHSKCTLAEAEVVLLQDQYNQWFVARVKTMAKDGTDVQLNSSGSANFAKYRDVDVQTPNSKQEDEIVIRYFVTKKVKYIWNTSKQAFIKLRGFEEKTSCSYFHGLDGLTYNDQIKRRILYGENIIVVHVTPIVKLLFKEVLSPFYIFQLFSCILWYTDSYEYYASAIVLISTISITATIYQTRKMQRALRNTIHSSATVFVCRGEGVFDEIPSEDLVPGDMIEIPRHGCIMQCDAVLTGGNCIVNESMLTGESVPVTKTPLPNPGLSHSQEVYFNVKDHARHILFCGTHVIQTRFYGNQRVCAVVVRTGFSTSKGELVRSIMYPQPVDFRFNRDTYYFILILASVAVIGFIYTIVLMVQRGDEPGDIAKRSLDLFTIAVPAALPAALTVGIVFAQSRLKHSSVYCISPRSINVCGAINVVCFDKTGTLTEDGLDMQGIVPSSNGSFCEEIVDMSKIPKGSIAVAMATCHSLTIIDGDVCGDPLDLIIFEAIGWELEEPGEEETRFDMIVPTVVRPKNILGQSMNVGNEKEEHGIVRQFTFSSSLQRMSVITRKLGAPNFDLYCKGAPEMVASLAKPETVPKNFHDVLMSYTKHGYRVLAIAWKPLSEKVNYVKVQRIQREKVESDLTFIGLIVMENRLKPETTPVINKLLQANIRTVMVTGDNMLTAMSVARECGMVQPNDRIILLQAYPSVGQSPPQLEFVYADDKEKTVTEVTTRSSSKGNIMIDVEEQDERYHFAVSGKSWDVLKRHFPDVITKVAVRGTVFGRMSPEQKAQLVEILQKLGYYVGMCGDGANDCGALKAAHAGISLSEAEASVASPFTSKTPNIECVPTVIREGRAALVTSFGIFKYMACYSLTQFISVLLLYWIGANLTDFEFLYIDLFLLTTLGVTFGRTGAYKELHKEPPTVSLVSFGPILSFIIQMLIMCAAQVYYYFDVQTQPWFVPYAINEDESYVSYENTAIFYISAYQYIILAVIFSKGAPYRKTIFSNYWFLGNLALCIGATLWITIYPIHELSDFLELKPHPSVPYRATFVGIAAVNFLLSLIVEMFFIDSKFITKTCQKALENCCAVSKYPYAILDQEISKSATWPPVKPLSGNLADLFQRLDSMYESTAFRAQEYDKQSLLDSDNDSRKGSMSSSGSRKRPSSLTPSFTQNNQSINTAKLDVRHQPYSINADDIALTKDEQVSPDERYSGGLTNLAYSSEVEQFNNVGNLSTQL